MRIAVLWGLLALLCQQMIVSSHVLGRPSSTNDLAQLKALLQHFEETLAEAPGEGNSEADYGETNQEPEENQASHGWSQNQEEDQEPWISERAQSLAEGNRRTMSQRDRLQDLLITSKKRASSCFGARMDRIGNTSGLGCNNGRG